MGPLGAAAFARHLPQAIEGAEQQGTSLVLVVIRVTSGKRGRRRFLAALRRAEAFAYEIQPGGYALLMPSATAWDALEAALAVWSGARGGLLRAGALVASGIAVYEPGEDAHRLFGRAATALVEAEFDGDPARVAPQPGSEIRVTE